jgi:hypothetical protein
MTLFAGQHLDLKVFREVGVDSFLSPTDIPITPSAIASTPIPVWFPCFFPSICLLAVHRFLREQVGNGFTVKSSLI